VSSIVTFLPRNMPPKPTVADPDGRAMLLYTCVFQHRDREFSLNLAAHSWDDAQDRLSSLRQSISIEGELEAEGGIDFVPTIFPHV
jgi:hypothetical protein